MCEDCNKNSNLIDSLFLQGLDNHKKDYRAKVSAVKSIKTREFNSGETTRKRPGVNMKGSFTLF